MTTIRRDDSYSGIDSYLEEPYSSKPDSESEKSSFDRQYVSQQAQNSDSTINENIVNRQVENTLFEKTPTPAQNGEAGILVKDLDWDGPNDPENPKNWGSAKKWVITITAGIMCLSVTAGSSLYVAGLESLHDEFGASDVLILSGLTFYLIGLSLGPILGAPLSEKFGRKVVYLATIPSAMLLVMGIGLSHNLPAILVLRFLAGFVSSPVMAIAGGTVADLWDFETFGITMSAFCFAPFAGPMVGPIAGGFAAQYRGWRFTQWISLMLSGLVLPFVLWMPETYKPTILQKRAKKRGIKVLKPKLSFTGHLKAIFITTVRRPLEMLLWREPIVSFLSIYTAFVFAILFGFFESYTVIYSGVYKLQGGLAGLPFIGVGLGLLLGMVIFIIIDRVKFYPKQPDGTRIPKDSDGNKIPPIPEARLIGAKIGAVLLPISLFWQAWTIRPDIQWMAPITAGVPFGISLYLISFNVTYYFTLSYPVVILASSLSANNFARYITASVYPLFTIQMYERMGNNWASSLFGFIALAMMPIPWVFERYGASLRAKSYYNNLIKREEEERNNSMNKEMTLEDEELLADALSPNQSIV